MDGEHTSLLTMPRREEADGSGRRLSPGQNPEDRMSCKVSTEDRLLALGRLKLT